MVRLPGERRPDGGDGGYTLIELLIGMVIMSVVMVVVTGGISQIYSASSQTDNTASAREQLLNSFRRLDKEIRYASWVATPGQVGTRWYMEYAMAAKCRQLAFDSGVLWLYDYAPTATSTGTPTKIAADLSLVGTTAPFTVYKAGTIPFSTSADTWGVGKKFSPEHTQVRVRFNGVVGRITLPFDVVFTAQNTSRNTPAVNDCGDGRPTV